MLSLSKLRTLFGLAVRYAAAGAINSIVGVLVVIGLDRTRWLSASLVNFCGFAAGLALGFLMHREIFTAERTRAETIRYFTAVALAFVLNQIALKTALLLLPAMPSLLAQAVGITVYGCTLFLLSRFWVFRAPSEAAA